MITLAVTRYFIGKEETEAALTVTFGVDAGNEQKTLNLAMKHKFELPDFLEPWREMSETEAKDYVRRENAEKQNREDDENEE